MNGKRIKLRSFAAFSFLLLPGCIESQKAEQQPMFEVKELDACMAIVVDMSSSYEDYWDTRAHTLFLQLMDQFFTHGMGSESRIVLGQLSGERKVVLFEGTPSDLRSRFRSPKDLADFLKANSDPEKSRVFHATSEITEHLTSMSDVTENTRLLTVILSDGINTRGSDQEVAQEEGRMKAALSAYQQKGGSFAMYYVSDQQTSFWQSTLSEAGFEPGSFVIEGELTASPQLPRFE